MLFAFITIGKVCWIFIIRFEIALCSELKFQFFFLLFLFVIIFLK